MGLRLALAWLFLLAAATVASATTFYTDHLCGNIPNYNPLTRACVGGLSTNRTTIAGGVALLSAGDTLRIRAGTYSEKVTMVSGPSGTSYSNAPIIEAQTGETVIWSVPNGQVEALRVENVQFLIIRGIIFDGTLGSNSLLQNQYTSIAVSGAEKLITVGCIGSSTTLCGREIRVENNTFRNTAYGAIQPCQHCGRMEILRNIFHDMGKVENCATIYILSPDVLVDGNTFARLPCGAVAFYNEFANTTHRGIVRGNLFEDIGLYWAAQNGSRECCATGGCPLGIDCGARIAQGSVNIRAVPIQLARGNDHQAYNNVIKNSVRGINVLNFAGNCLIANNTIVGNTSPNGGFNESSAGIAIEADAGPCVVRNNIVHQPPITVPPPMASLSSGNMFSNNLCSSPATGCTPQLAGINPQFVNTQTDFHLTQGSHAINAGSNLVGFFSNDFDGNPRDALFDLGAYEFIPALANTYSLTRSLATVQAGQTITASWQTTPGPAQVLDWIGLVRAGDPSQNFISLDGAQNAAWRYIGDGVTTAPLTGAFPIAAPLAEGSYEFIYCINDGFTCPARSATFAVTTPPVASGLIVRTTRWHQADHPEAVDANDPHWIEAENASIRIVPGGKVRYRVAIECDGCVTTPEYFALHCDKNLADTWTRLTTSCSPFGICIGQDSAVNEGDPTTRLLTLRSGLTGAPGRFVVDSINTTRTVTPANLQQFEIEYAVHTDPSLSPGTVVRCRPQHNNGNMLTGTNPYLVQPSLVLYEGTVGIRSGTFTSGTFR